MTKKAETLNGEALDTAYNRAKRQYVYLRPAPRKDASKVGRVQEAVKHGEPIMLVHTGGQAQLKYDGQIYRVGDQITLVGAPHDGRLIELGYFAALEDWEGNTDHSKKAEHWKRDIAPLRQRVNDARTQLDRAGRAVAVCEAALASSRNREKDAEFVVATLEGELAEAIEPMMPAEG